ncbi:hypothetical protein [Nocardioides sp. ChNu-99]|uniref:hypothetical protein n=1 Tax=Nocardioides sp. ChNu-99 TaxID=2839897 RepID=UPI0024059402|nr:hypothetical protein [Nocardioides sp. ChNu-99]MDF9718123.1 hypothetical protein [Nocardioides sp. ChNu-99]
MNPDDPRHGTYAGACQHQRDGERVEDCPPCLNARRVYHRRRGKLRTMGRPGYLEVTAAHLAKITSARASGMSAQQVADAIGFDLTALLRITNAGEGYRVRAATWQLLDQWRPQPPAVTGVGVLRRLQALTWMGWSAGQLSARFGIHEQTITEGLNLSRTIWHEHTTTRIVDGYSRLWQTPPPTGTSREKAAATRLRRVARERGYVPGAAWDNIDDASETPKGTGVEHRGDVDEVKVARIVDGDFHLPATTAERREVCARWATTGRPFAELARGTGWKIERYFRPELTEGAA